MTLSVLSVFGTRPEAIKMAPVIAAMRKNPGFNSSVCVTGQHRGLLDSVLEVFDIEPEHDLDLMSPGQDLFDVTTRVLLGMREVMQSERPDVVLVHGDTTTSFAAALAAFYEDIPVGHVEAGLRTGVQRLPFPEEMNRCLTGWLATLHFAPTDQARANLLAEGVSGSAIHVTGNTVVDALQATRARVADRAAYQWMDELGVELCSALERKPDDERIILITGHRRESFGDGLLGLCNAIQCATERYENWRFIYAVHPNPNVNGPVHERLGALDRVHLVAPVDYAPFVWLMDRCDLVLTDSGGIQEEAPSLGKPVLVTRDVTERPEAIEAGTVRLVGTDEAVIVTSLEDVLLNETTYEHMSRAHNPYGDGHAAGRIVDALLAREYATAIGGAA